ncbi:MAG: carboxymuconolactone decarboxylase family protein [Ignavibacteriaceae bacterium]|jgi:AhpD family alkylhydroperoxidase|nr:carboxymuconolactone decarboxylase family protein [Ignavibacteriaceae bacterium]
MTYLPEQFKKFKQDFPEIYLAYENLGDSVHKAGPLNEKIRALIKLAISAGARLEGAVKSHTRKALDAGCTLEEIKQTALIALPTLGFPSTVAVLSWMEEVIVKR